MFLHLVEQQFIVFDGLVLIAVHALVGEDLEVALLVEDAVHLEGFDLGDRVDQFLVADDKLKAFRLILHQCLVDQAVDRFISQLELLLEGRIELVLIDVLVDLVKIAVSALEVIKGDRLAIHDCGFRCRAFISRAARCTEHCVADHEA